MSLQGSYVALATPFRDGAIDYSAFSGLIERQVAARSDGLVVAGTTGESATLDSAEYRALVEFTRGAVRGRLPVLIGVGTNATRETVERARIAESSGADGLLVVTPYYNRPGQRGLLAHFAAVAQTTRLPIVLYNIPKRTGCDLEPATAAALAATHPNIVAIKETVCTKERFAALIEAGLAVFTGEDTFLADGMQWGASGAISVIGNLRPAQVAELLRCAVPGGDANRAAAFVEELAPLIDALGLESNPAPLKHALEALGLASGELRLPLVSVTEETARVIEERLGT